MMILPEQYVIGKFDKGEVKKGFIWLGSNGHFYFGEFSGNMQHGKGFYDYNDEWAYKGTFSEGDFNGDGKFYYNFDEWDESKWKQN